VKSPNLGFQALKRFNPTFEYQLYNPPQLAELGFLSENLGDSATAREFRGPSVEEVSVTSIKSSGQHRRTEVVPRGHQFKKGVNHS
jgi:hypothetical protein